VDVDTEAYVVGKVPADVVGIRIEDDVVGAPVPAVAVGDVGGSNAEEESAEAEAVRSASGETPNLACTYGAGEVSMFPGMVEVVASVVGGDVTDPAIGAGVDVGRSGVPGGIRLTASGQGRVAGGTMGGYVSAADGSAGGSAAGRWMRACPGMGTGGALGVSGKGEGEKRKSRENCQRADEFLHDSSV